MASSSRSRKGYAQVASRVPTTLRARLGEQAAVELLEMLDEEHGNWSDRVITLAEERFNRRLTEALAALRGEMGQLEIRLRREMHEGFSAMLKWSSLFWIGQVAAIAGLLSFMLRGAPI